MSTIAIETTHRDHAIVRPRHTEPQLYLTTALLVAMIVLAPVTIAAAVLGSSVVVVSAGVMVSLLAVVYVFRKVLLVEG